MTKWFAVFPMAAVALLGGARCAGAAPYCFQQGFLYSGGAYSAVYGPGGGCTEPVAINNSGAVIGGGPSAGDGFIKSGGAYTVIHMPGYRYGFLEGINNNDVVVGQAYNTGVQQQIGFSWSKGVYTPIIVPGSPVTRPFAINDSGVVVGDYVGTYHTQQTDFGFLDSGGTYTTLQVPGSNNTVATYVNNSGVVVGFYGMGMFPDFGSFLYKNGVYTVFKIPQSMGIGGGQVSAVNDSGVIAGTFENSAFKTLGFVDSGGVYTVVDVPGSTFTSITDINDAGEVVGQFGNGHTELGFTELNGVYTILQQGPYGTFPFDINDSGAVVGYYQASPSPEPAVWILCLIGFGVLGQNLRRHSGQRHALRPLAVPI